MMRLISILTVLVLAVMYGTAWADRCVGPMDTTAYVTQTWGIAPFTAADIVWCDDFDSYCDLKCADICCPAVTGTTCTNPTKCITAWQGPPTYWPGYPTPGDDPCDLNALDPDGCNNSRFSEWWMKTANTIDHHNWDKDWGGPNFGVDNADGNHGGKRLEGWNGNGGWASLPYVVEQAGNQSPIGRAYYEFDMAAGIGHKYTGSNAVNGSDTDPLVLRFWTSDNVDLGQYAQADWGFPPNWQFYMELRLAPDRAPVDFVMAAATIPTCGTEQVDWPIICQQNPSGAGSLPTNCPDIGLHPRPYHNSLAFGWVAALDLNPCDVDTGRQPTMYHAATFDGQQWFRLIANQHSGNGGDFNYDMQQGFFEMTIKSTTYDVRLIAPWDCTKQGCTNGYNSIADNTAIDLHRNYTGAFNYVSMGAGLGCQLDPDNPWQCLSTSTRDTSHWTWYSNPVYVDRPVVFGGQSNKGSCCHRDTTCTPDVTPLACLAVGDRFRSGAKCPDQGGPRCCPWPFADSDGDHDVDQADFAAFQLCYTGDTGGITGCECWDRDTVHTGIGPGDFAEFQKCWTGPDVPFPEVLPWPTGCTP